MESLTYRYIRMFLLFRLAISDDSNKNRLLLIQKPVIGNYIAEGLLSVISAALSFVALF